MSVNINTFREFVLFVSNKVQSGNSVTVPQFNVNCQRSQMQLYERDYQTFLRTGEISDFLTTFLKPAIFNVPITGEQSYPSDLHHLASLRKYYVNVKGVGNMIDVDEISNVAWGFAQISSLNAPSIRFPKYNEFSDVIRFLPRNIGIVECDYFKTPVEPVWNFTVVNGRPVYDPATSVDFEWLDFSTNAVVGVYLSLIGINLKDGDISQFSQAYQQQNNSTL